MKLKRWTEIFELIAIIAVVGSLIAVVVELRQTQTALRAQAYQSRAFDGIATNFQIARDERWQELWVRINSCDLDLSSLSDADLNVARSLLTIIRIDVDNEHYQFQHGFLDPGFYHGETTGWIRCVAPLWRGLGDVEPRPDFRAEVDRLLAE